MKEKQYRIHILLILATSYLVQISHQKFINDTRSLSLQSTVENQELESCEYCKQCDLDICLECQDGFNWNSTSEVCISSCQEGFYLDIYNSGQCKPHCSHFSEDEDDLHRVCKRVKDCSLMMEIGNEYPQELQEQHTIDEDLNIMISSDYYNITLFDLFSGVQISQIVQSQGIRQLLYKSKVKELYVLNANGDVLIYDLRQIHLKEQFIRRNTELLNWKTKQKSVLILQQNLILLFGVEKNIYLFNYEVQKVQYVFSTGRYTEIIMFDYFNNPMYSLQQEKISNNEFLELMPLYFTIETDQNLNYFINILEEQNTYNLKNQSKIINFSIFRRNRLLILEESTLYTFSSQEFNFPENWSYKANKQNQEKFQKFIVSADQTSIILLSSNNNLHILDQDLNLIALIVNGPNIPQITQFYAKNLNEQFTYDSSNKLSLWKLREENSVKQYERIAQIEVKMENTKKIYVSDINSSYLYLIGDGVIQIKQIDVSTGIKDTQLTISNQISKNINFNYNITSSETDVSLNELNQFIFHYDISNITAYPYINIYDFILKSHIKSIDLSAYIKPIGDLQKILYVEQIGFSTIITLSNQIIINYDNQKMKVVEYFDLSLQNNNTIFTKQLCIPQKRTIIFYNEYYLVMYEIQNNGEDYLLVRGKEYQDMQEDNQPFSIQLILNLPHLNQLTLFNSQMISAKLINEGSMAVASHIIQANKENKIFQAKFNPSESLMIVTFHDGNIIIQSLINQSLRAQYGDDSVQFKDFWFLEVNIFLF